MPSDMRLYYCPVCGCSAAHRYDVFYCKKCGNNSIEPMLSKYSISYYQNIAEKRFPKKEDGLIHGTKGMRRFEEILLEEISQNPLFDREKCMNWIRLENEKYDKWQSGELDLSVPPIETVTPTKQATTPKCPVCNSTRLKKISAAKRGLHAWAFGIFSKTAFSQFECEDCGYKF